jgi:putative ABC transport system substrate-binding protein
MQGGFMAYGPGGVHLYREILAKQLVQLFRGVKPADIPVELPTKFELWINLKTANAMGVTVPAILLARAESNKGLRCRYWHVSTGRIACRDVG